MKTYFEAEMRLLHELAQDFAAAHPEQAVMLNMTALRDRDPYIERLLEGTAFLTAQIRQRIDDDLPDICETFLQQLYPQLLRPFPAATIMQFYADSANFNSSLLLGSRLKINSKPVGEQDHKVACEFRTIAPVKLNPLMITSITTDETHDAETLIYIKFRTVGDVSLNSLDLADLVAYIHADPASALNWFWALTAKVKQIVVRYGSTTQEGQQPLAGQEAIVPTYLATPQSLLPAAERSFPGLQLLQEYFAFRDKFLFVTFRGLENIHFTQACKEFTLVITADMTFAREQLINKQVLQLHCVPAVNLFTTSSEPINLTHQRVEYPIITNSAETEAILLFSVDQVTGIGNRSNKRRPYFPMVSLRQRKADEGYYHLAQRDTGMKFPATYITADTDMKDPDNVLTALLTACNGHYPRRFLSEKSITTLTEKELPRYVYVHNLLRPSPLLLPPTRAQFRWELLAHLSLNYQSLSDLTVLQRMLGLYDWTDRVENQRRIQGIKQIQIQPVRRLWQGAFIQGLSFQLNLAEDHYLSPADIYLFGAVLQQFFAEYAPMNMYVMTKITCYPSQKEFTWQTIQGRNQLI